MIVTIWERLNGEKWEHNHYEPGWDGGRTTPTPLHETHVKAWASGKWRAIMGDLTDGVLTRTHLNTESSRQPPESP